MVFNAIIILFISNTFSYLIIPLNKVKQNLTYISDPKEVIQKLYNAEIYAEIEIGSERKKVKTFLTHQRTELIIGGKLVKNHQYDETLSKTYICVYNK